MGAARKKFREKGPDGQDHEFNSIGWLAFDKARERQQRRALDLAKGAGAELIELFDELRRRREEEDDDTLDGVVEQAEAEKANPHDPSNFDTETILRSGLKHLSDDEVENLPEDVATWLKVRIIEVSKPRSKEEKKES